MGVKEELKEAMEGKKKEQPNLNILSIPEFKDIEQGLRRTGDKLDKLGSQEEENTGKITSTLERLGRALGLIQEEIIKSKPPEPLEEVKVKNFPKTTKVEKPAWYKAPDSKEITIPLAKVINDAVERISKRVSRTHITNQNPEDAVAVRLTSKDGTKFYNAIMGAISAVGSVFPFINTSGNKQEALTDVDGHIQVDVLTAPGTSSSTTPTIYNVTMTNADTEYSQALPAGTDRFSLQCQGAYDMRFAFVTGKVAAPTAPYGTVKNGMNYFEAGLTLTGVTIYVACGTGAQVAELVVWT